MSPAKPRNVLILDSHALSDYQRCPRLFTYTYILKLEPIVDRKAFARGSVISNMLQDYYALKIAKNLDKAGILDIINKQLLPSALSDEDKTLIEFRFMRYWQNYRDEMWIPLAVETGFSEILYEDDEYLFVYEGRPDLVIQTGHNGPRAIVDHKSQSMDYDIYAYNNQALGYCAMNKTKYFVYNFFGLQTTGDSRKWFHRQTISYSKSQLDGWREDTIKWFKRILQDVDRLKSLRCESKFGICAYHKLCETTEDWAREDKIKREFKKKDFVVWPSAETVGTINEI